MAWQVAGLQTSWGPDQVHRNCVLRWYFRQLKTYQCWHSVIFQSQGPWRESPGILASVSLAQREELKMPVGIGSPLIPAAGPCQGLLCAAEEAEIDLKMLTFN